MSVLSDLATILEAVTEEYAQACDRAAEAENEAERAELTEFARLRADGEAVSSAEKIAKFKSLDERALHRIAASSERALLRKVRSVEARLNAAQSHLKFLGSQT